MALPSFAQETTGANNTKGSEEPDNKHVQVFRYTVPAHMEVTLQKLNRESVLVWVRGESLKRIPEKGAPEIWERGPGSVAWDRSGIAYSIENLGDTPTELLVIEIKDSNILGQLNVPWSDHDPIHIDPRHFRLELENEHVRILRLHLGPKEETLESQFSMHVDIAVSDVHIGETYADGVTNQEYRASGSVSWNSKKLQSFVNLDARPLDATILELKHPFCYETSDEWKAGPDTDLNMLPYLNRVRETVQKRWLKEMPRAARDGEKGLVEVKFKVQKDGTVPEEGMLFNTVFATDSLAEATLSTIRRAAPFQPLPPFYQKPNATMTFSFLYNIPNTRPPGCP